jgi:hypothetical protein
MLASIIRFVLTFAGVWFTTAMLLLCYEGAKPGGYKKGCEPTIIGFSIAVGLVAALMSTGLLGGSLHMMYAD